MYVHLYFLVTQNKFVRSLFIFYQLQLLLKKNCRSKPYCPYQIF